MHANIFSQLVVIVLFSMLVSSCGSDDATVNDGNPNKPYSGYCASPAPLHGTYNPSAPGYIITFKDGVDAQTETDRLATIYDIQVWNVLAGFNMTTADMSADTREHVRCESSVESMSYNGIGQGA